MMMKTTHGRTTNMTTQDTKQMIVENFIDWFTSDESMRESMKLALDAYMQEDHVDEITDAYPELA